MDCHAVLQGLIPTQGLNPCLLCLMHCRQILYRWATREALMAMSESRSVVSDSLQPHGLYTPWNSPGQNTGEAFPFSRGSSQPRNWIQVSCIAGGFFTSWATREALMAEGEPNNPAVQWPCGQSPLHQRCQPKASPRSKMVPHLWPWSSPRSSSSVSTMLSISGPEIQTHLRVKGPDSTKPKCSFIKLQLKTGMSSFQLVNRKLWPQKTSLRSELHSEYKIKVREARCYKKYFHQTVVHVISFCSSLSRPFYPVHEHFSTDSTSLTDSFPCLSLFSVASQLSESSSQNCCFIAFGWSLWQIWLHFLIWLGGFMTFLIASLLGQFPLHLVLGFLVCVLLGLWVHIIKEEAIWKHEGLAARLEKLVWQETCCGENRLYRKGGWHEGLSSL